MGIIFEWDAENTMALTRVEFEKINGKPEIIKKQTNIHDDNPVIYYGNEDHSIKNDDDVNLIARGFAAFKKYLSKKSRTKTEDTKVARSS